jgi:hypothetical protein
MDRGIGGGELLVRWGGAPLGLRASKASKSAVGGDMVYFNAPEKKIKK